MHVRHLETPGKQRPENSSPGHAETDSKTTADSTHRLRAKYSTHIISFSVRKTLWHRPSYSHFIDEAVDSGGVGVHFHTQFQCPLIPEPRLLTMAARG